MEDQLVNLLAGTQSPAAATRTQAEESLNQLYTDEGFPLALVSIASHHTVQIEIRQSALLTLKNYVLAGWSPSLDEFKGHILLGDGTKSRLREALFDLSTSNTAERKIQNAASFVVSQIASADYPDQWPSLLDALLRIIPEASDTKLHGALKVLAELVQDGLDEGQFFRAAQNLVNVLFLVAADESRKPVLRALAVSIFKECFNTLQVVMEDHKQDVKAFAEQSLSSWVPVFLKVLNAPLGVPPEGPQAESDGSLELYRGMVALKVQVARVCPPRHLLLPILNRIAGPRHHQKHSAIRPIAAKPCSILGSMGRAVAITGDIPVHLHRERRRESSRRSRRSPVHFGLCNPRGSRLHAVLSESAANKEGA